MSISSAMLFCVLLLSMQVGAWSAVGHKALSRAAFITLTDSERAYYTKIAQQLARRDGKAGSRRSGADSFSHISVLADELRDISLQDVFRRYEEKLPAKLRPFAQRNTSNWHYYNNVRDKVQARDCHFSNKGKLMDAALLLDRQLKEKLSSTQEALVLAFLIHLIEDLHQPLHTFTSLSASCESDRGGNQTCYRKGMLGKPCKRNLHAEWDRGFGVFKHPIKPYRGTGSALIFAPTRWIIDGMKDFDTVYDMQNKNYRRRAKETLEKNTGLALARLSHYLKAHYQRKSTE